jgi:CheY-like chemotaxis protein
MNPLFSRPDDVRVLHVDDEPRFVEMAATHLERQDPELSVTTETDPVASLDRLAEQRVDCVVSDYDMPDVDGLELLRRVRERDEDLPFVLFTGKGSEEVAAKAIDAGVDAYLRKEAAPSQFVVLANRIRSQVDQMWAVRRARKMEETYELVARAATDAFWIRDMTTGETLYSEGIEQFGYDPGVREDGFEWWVERVHPDDRQASRDLNELQRAGAPGGFDEMDREYGEFTHEYRWRRADGSYVSCVSHGIVRFEDDDPVEMVGAMTTLDDHGAEE